MIKQLRNREEFISFVIEHTSAMVYVCDMQTNRILFANEYSRRELGLEEGQICCECGICNHEQLVQNPNGISRVERYNPKLDRWFECLSQAIPWTDGRFVRLEIALDSTERKRSAPKRSDETAPYQSAYSQLILESIGDAVIVTDNAGIITMMNLQAQRLTGWFGDSGVGHVLSQVFHIVNTQTRKVVENPVGKVLATGKIVGLANHTSLISRDGVEYHISDSAAPVRDLNGDIHGVILVFRDISEEYRQQEALRSSEARFRTLMETSINAIALHEIITDDQGRPVDYRFLEVNRSFENFTGLSAKDILGKTVLEVMPGTEQVWIDTYGEVAQTGVPQDLEDFSQDLDKYFSVRAYSPKRGQFVTVFEDITQRKQMENRLKEQVYEDTLTGLHNRRYLESQLPRLEGEENLPLSAIIGDVNGLKIINDSMGHLKGDKVLKQVAQVFREVARPEDIVIRWGGDEFVMILPCTSSVQAQSMCIEINTRTLANDQAGLIPSIALGYATKTELGGDISSVLRIAETSMYQQKISSAESRRSALVLSLQQALAEKSHETDEHARNLQQLAIKLAKRMGLSDSEIVTSSLVALLHDIGKIAISENILDKPGPLNDDEWELMKRHSEIGHRIVASSSDLLDVAEGVLHHHERWDGAGYPKGLKGTEIPISSRIVALADAFDAMTTDRSYRVALTLSEARDEIAAGAGHQFDPALAQEFLAILDEDSI